MEFLALGCILGFLIWKSKPLWWKKNRRSSSRTGSGQAKNQATATPATPGPTAGAGSYDPSTAYQSHQLLATRREKKEWVWAGVLGAFLLALIPVVVWMYAGPNFVAFVTKYWTVGGLLFVGAIAMGVGTYVQKDLRKGAIPSWIGFAILVIAVGLAVVKLVKIL